MNADITAINKVSTQEIHEIITVDQVSSFTTIFSQFLFAIALKAGVEYVKNG